MKDILTLDQLKDGAGDSIMWSSYQFALAVTLMLGTILFSGEK